MGTSTGSGRSVAAVHPGQKVALIPGGIKGIGKAVALQLARRGWAIALCYRTSHADAEATRDALEALGTPVWLKPIDVSTEGGCRALVSEVVQWGGRVDALVHCVGPYHKVDLLDETPARWRETFAGNVDSLFQLSQLVAPGMIERRWGRIVAFTMANADRLLAQTQVTAHHLAKAGVLGLVRAFAKRLAPHNITVNAVAPGFIATGGMPETELAAMQKHIPAGRVGTAAEAAHAALFLLTDEADYVTGTNIHVSGGWGI